MSGRAEFEIRTAETAGAMGTAGREDLVAVRTLLETAGLPLDGVEEQFGEGYALAESDGLLVGVVGVERYGSYGLLRSAATSADWRGRGVGKALTNERIAWAKARGIEALYLLTMTAPDFFSRFGFTAVERSAVPGEIRASREFSSACPESAIVMVLPL